MCAYYVLNIKSVVNTTFIREHGKEPRITRSSARPIWDSFVELDKGPCIIIRSPKYNLYMTCPRRISNID